VSGIDCIATRIRQNKRKWVSWRGDAFFDWHAESVTIPSGGEVTSDWVDADITTWPDYDGEIPELKAASDARLLAVLRFNQTWDSAKDDEVPELGAPLVKVAVLDKKLMNPERSRKVQTQKGAMRSEGG
jgi:hypothetical protein